MAVLHTYLKVISFHEHANHIDFHPIITFYKLALPRDSNGIKSTRSPAAINKAPEVYTGAEVLRLANIAIIGYVRVLAIKATALVGTTYSHYTKDAISSCSDCISSPTVLRGENFRSERVQHSIHNVAEEVECTVPAK